MEKEPRAWKITRIYSWVRHFAHSTMEYFRHSIIDATYKYIDSNANKTNDSVRFMLIDTQMYRPIYEESAFNDRIRSNKQYKLLFIFIASPPFARTHFYCLFIFTLRFVLEINEELFELCAHLIAQQAAHTSFLIIRNESISLTYFSDSGNISYADNILVRMLLFIDL